MAGQGASLNDILLAATQNGQPITFSQGEGVDYNPQEGENSLTRLLAQRLDPFAAQRYLSGTLDAKAHGQDVSFGPEFKEGLQAQQLALQDPNSLLGGELQQQHNATGSSYGAAQGSGWTTDNRANLAIAQQLANERMAKDYSYEDQSRALDLARQRAQLAGMPGQGAMQPSYGGVMETPLQRRNFLLQLLGTVR